MNLESLKSALETELKPSKKPLPRVLNNNLLRAGQLQRRYSTVSNSSSIAWLGSVSGPRQPSNLAEPRYITLVEITYICIIFLFISFNSMYICIVTFQIKVTVAGLTGNEPVKCSRDIVIVPDTSLEDAKPNKYDVVILPGGLGGSKAMAESPLVGEILKQQESEGRVVAAICAAPTALAAHGICSGKSLTSYPSVKSQLESNYKYVYICMTFCNLVMKFFIFRYVDDKTVVQDGNLITSRGPGTAFAFGIKIAEVLAGSDKASEVAKGMLLN